MKFIKTLLALFALIIAGVVLWFYLSIDSETLRYRLTYQIGVKNDVKIGSSVTQIGWTDTRKLLLPNTGVGHRVRGEAVVIGLGNDRFIFSLLKGQSYKTDPNELVINAYNLTRGRYRGYSLVASVRELNKFSKKVELNSSASPLLVTFTDINDPKTVMRVDPDDMDAVLGCSKPQLAKDFPWRAQGRPWRQWYKFEAYREAILNAGEEAGLPADYSRYAVLEKLNGAFNNGIVKKTEPKYMPPPKGYEADKLQLASMWSAIQAKYGKSPLREMYRQHRVAAAKLRKTYLERGRDTANDCHRLKSLTLEITDEPVTNGEVEKVLGKAFFKKFARQFKAGLKSKDYDNSKLFYRLSKNLFIEE